MRAFNNILKLLVILCFSLPVMAQAYVATVEAIGGANTVQVKRMGQSMSLKRGEHLEVGDEVITDKSTAVDIRFEDQTILRLGINSSYKISEDGKSKKLLHKFISGIIRVLVPAKKENKDTIKFKMSTPEATIGVRGTEFVVTRLADNTNLKGLTGEVFFGPADTDFDKQDLFVKVRGGFESNIKKGMKLPTNPAKFDAAAYLVNLERHEGNPFGALYTRTNEKSSKQKGALIGKSGKAKSVESAEGVKKLNSFLKSKTTTVKNKDDTDGLLILALVKNDEKMASKAVSGKANVNLKDEEGNSLVHYSASLGRVEILKNVILPANADVNVKNNKGQTPLILLASEAGSVEVAQILIEHGANIQEKDAEGHSAMDLALEAQESDDAEVSARAAKLVELFKEASL